VCWCLGTCCLFGGGFATVGEHAQELRCRAGTPRALQCGFLAASEMDIGLAVRSPLDALDLPSRDVSTLLRYLSLTRVQRAALVQAELVEVVATAHRATARLVERLKLASTQGIKAESFNRAVGAMQEILESLMEPAAGRALDETGRRRLEWFRQHDDWGRYVDLALYAGVHRPAGILLGNPLTDAEQERPLLEQFATVLVSSLWQRLGPFRTAHYADPLLMDALLSTTAFLRNSTARIIFSTSNVFHEGDGEPNKAAEAAEMPSAPSSFFGKQYVHGISALSAYLEQPAAAPLEVIYQVLFSLWLLSFSVREIGPEPFESGRLPLRLNGVLRELKAQKAVRLTLAVLRNLSEDATLCREMIGAGIATYLGTNNAALRRWNDEELQLDVMHLRSRLAEELSSMTSLEMYLEELLVGSLDWTPAHRDAAFWEENANKFEAENWKVLRRLCTLIRDSQDAHTLNIAMNDVCEILRVQPRARLILETEQIKPRLLELLTHSSSDVKRRALSCLQRLVLSGSRAIPSMN